MLQGPPSQGLPPQQQEAPMQQQPMQMQQQPMQMQQQPMQMQPQGQGQAPPPMSQISYGMQGTAPPANAAEKYAEQGPPMTPPPGQAMVQMDQDKAVEATPGGPVPTARDDYPNPCGRCADIGRWRDIWFALLWVGAGVFLVMMGAGKHATEEVYAPCHGTTTLSVRGFDWEWNESENATRREYASTADCLSFNQGAGEADYYINLACDEDFLYALMIPTTDDNGELLSRDECNDIHDRHSVKADVETIVYQKWKAFPQTQPFTKEFQQMNGLKELTVHATGCELYSSAMSRAIWLLGLKAAGVSFLLALIFVLMSRVFPEKTIKLLCVAYVLYMIGLALYAVHRDAWWLMTSCLVAGAFVACMLFTVWERIPFAAVCLKGSAVVVLKHWGMMVAAFVTFGLVIMATVFFVLGVGTKDALADTSSGLFIALIFALFWVEEVLCNIAHVTAVGSVADWFYSQGCPAAPQLFANGKRSYPSAGSFRRAITWSLGSICLGSIFTTIIKWIRWFFKTVHDSLGPAACLCKCFLACADSCMRLFNDYAFVHVGVYGKPYMTAAKQSWDGLRYGTGWDLIIQDALIDSVFLVFILLGTFLTTTLCYALDFCPKDTCDESMGLMVAGIIAFIIQMVMMRLLYSGVITIFVCYADLKKFGVAWDPPSVGGSPAPLHAALSDRYQKYQVHAETPNSADPEPQGVGPNSVVTEAS